MLRLCRLTQQEEVRDRRQYLSMCIDQKEHVDHMCRENQFPILVLIEMLRPFSCLKANTSMQREALVFPSVYEFSCCFKVFFCSLILPIYANIQTQASKEESESPPPTPQPSLCEQGRVSVRCAFELHLTLFLTTTKLSLF